MWRWALWEPETQEFKPKRAVCLWYNRYHCLNFSDYCAHVLPLKIISALDFCGLGRSVEDPEMIRPLLSYSHSYKPVTEEVREETIGINH